MLLMTIMDKLAIVCICVVFIGIIYAGFLHNATRWHFCRKCRFWHNEIGERTALLPRHGELGPTKDCKYCRK